MGVVMGVADRSLPHDSVEWPTAAASRRGVVLGHGAEHGREFTSGRQFILKYNGL